MDKEWQLRVSRSVLSKKRGEFVRPHYEKYSLANLASTIANHFHKSHGRAPPINDEPVKEVLEGSETVVFFLLDGFGNQLVNALSKDQALERVLSPNHYAAITTVFPSTTTTALASANTGLLPEQHGIIGHTMYLRKLGVVASLISFSPVADVLRGTLLSGGLNPRELMRGETIYEELAEEGIASAVLTKHPYGHSGLTQMIHGGAEIVTYNVASDMLVLLRKLLQAKKHRMIFAYWDAIDIAAHAYGAGEDEVLAEVRSFFYILQTELFKKLDRKLAKRTSFFMTGDHGHVTVKSENRVIANSYPGLLANLQIPPAGDSRASFIKTTSRGDEKIQKFFKQFRNKLELIPTDEAIEERFFGAGKMNNEIREALGDYLVLSKKNNAFLYSYRKRGDFDMIGYHGGMSQDEMLIPMIFGRFSN
ncbi:MAG: alkaline phosphatase family protein [Thaumarchaeota archaeon]|nr:alkaline phosphatase family protein [Nitrososphaerota archaeon]